MVDLKKLTNQTEFGIELKLPAEHLGGISAVKLCAINQYQGQSTK